MGKPQVAYRETITQFVEDTYTHKKQTGGSGQFAKIDYEIETGEQNSGYTFESHVTGGNVPRILVSCRKSISNQHDRRNISRLSTSRC